MPPQKGYRLSPLSVPITKCFSCVNASSESDCVNTTVTCAIGYQACFTEWSKAANRTLITKGCRQLAALRMASANSTCFHQNLTHSSDTPFPCISYSSKGNGHALCPAWEPSCKPGKNFPLRCAVKQLGEAPAVLFVQA